MLPKIAALVLIIAIFTIVGVVVFLVARANQTRSHAAAKESGNAGSTGAHSDSSGCSDGSSGGGCDGGGGD